MSKILLFYKLCFVVIATFADHEWPKITGVLTKPRFELKFKNIIKSDEIQSKSMLFVSCVSDTNKMIFLDTNDPEKEIADFIFAKGYIPKESDLPKATKKTETRDVTYLLSKLSDDELVRLLSNPKKREFDLNDIAQLSKDIQAVQAMSAGDGEGEGRVQTRFRSVTSRPAPSGPVFRLDHKPLTFSHKKDPTHFKAQQSLSNILYSRPLDRDPDDDDSKKEIMFDVLMAQLKTLCCSKTPPKPALSLPSLHGLSHVPNVPNFKPLLDDFKPIVPLNMGGTSTQYMFLIINDEITSNGTDDLISVDPDSLDGNSSALLLGPINSPLTDTQLKLVMNRITSELSKPEYLPLLTQISEGTISDSNIKIVNSLITGSETRRYIKPHRCNHQSKLAKIYGGPKWIICSGYLNINTPSIYDRK